MANEANDKIADVVGHFCLLIPSIFLVVYFEEIQTFLVDLMVTVYINTLLTGMGIFYRHVAYIYDII